MIKEIIKDENILKQKSAPFIFGEDDYLVQDLIDTAKSHGEDCAGLACIQIGVPKKIVVVAQGETFIPFINPIIIKKSPKTYIADEGCLSLDGIRKVKRHRSIKVVWATPDGQRKVQEFKGFIAQALQHEIDHCNGVLI